MAKKKPAKKSTPEIKPPESHCFNCNGTGEVCGNCGEAEAACLCDQDDEDENIILSFDPVECRDCKGTGK